MLRDVGMHGVDKAEVIHDFTDLGKNVADPFSALTILLESEVGGSESSLGVPQGLAIHKLGSLARIFCKGRLVVEGVYLRRATGHEELNDVLRPRGKVRDFWSEGTWLGCRSRRCFGGAQPGLLKDACKTESPKTSTHFPKSLTAGESAVVQRGEGLPVSGFVFLEFHGLGEIRILNQHPSCDGKIQFLYTIKPYALVRPRHKAENVTRCA